MAIYEARNRIYLAALTDPQRLYELQGALDAAQVYTQPEVDLFARVFFKPRRKQVASDNARLNAALDPAVDRFAALDEDPAETFRGQLTAFGNLYEFLGQIVPFSDVDLEKLYVFGKMLLKKLPRRGEDATPVSLGDDVALQYFRLQKQAEGDILLAAEGAQALYGPSETGTGKVEDEEESLSTLISRVNDRYGTDFVAQDLINGVTDHLVGDERMQQTATANDRAGFGIVAERAFDDALIDHHAGHARFINRVFSDEEMLVFLRTKVLDEVYRRLTAASA